MVGKTLSKKKILKSIIFVIGFIMCSYPLISGMVMQRYQKNTVATYENIINESVDITIEEELEKAQEYNSILYQTKGLSIEGIEDGLLSEENYNSLLDIPGNGIMGSIEIPKISVNLPIYHGTSDEVLDIGIGHVMEFSLPVGGENTRSVLTGHRGLPNAKLFTRLDEMQLGDLFYINVLDQILAYKVCEIIVVEPEDMEALEIQAGKDLVTLITCTPYGLNTHRLLVTGERVEYVSEEHESIEKQVVSPREFLFACLPFVFLLIVVIRMMKNFYKNRKKGVDDFGKD